MVSVLYLHQVYISSLTLMIPEGKNKKSKHRNRSKGNNCCYRNFDTCLENEKQMETWCYIKNRGGSPGPVHTF